jgi:5-methyltetrahydrofolate--homocysteine methyltransferase
VVSAPAGEQHGLPTAIVADLLRLHGFNVVDLGADCPAAEIATAAATHDRVVGVGICATTLDHTTRRSIAETVELVHERAHQPVLLGGAAIPSAADALSLGGDGWSADALDAVEWFDQRAGT